jgi:hypothetical protein
MRPMTVRRVFYEATVRGLVDKSDAGYGKVQIDLVRMRRAGQLPYHWLADNTRCQRKPQTLSGVEKALREAARLYRNALWDNAGSYVEIWLEKDALSRVLLPIAGEYDVPLMVARGYASLSFLDAAAEYIGGLDVPAHIYYLGVFDPSGVNAGEKIEDTLRELVPTAEIRFERLAVTPQQIAAWDLPTRPTKATDNRAKAFGEISVELDAIEPTRLRELVAATIERHPSPPTSSAQSRRRERTAVDRRTGRHGVPIRMRGNVGFLSAGLPQAERAAGCREFAGAGARLSRSGASVRAALAKAVAGPAAAKAILAEIARLPAYLIAITCSRTAAEHGNTVQSPATYGGPTSY